MKWLIFAISAAVVFGLTSCVSSMTPEQKAELAKQVADLVEKGIISTEQAKLILNDGAGWQDVAAQLGTAAVSIVGALLGVRFWRGSVNNRNGNLG